MIILANSIAFAVSFAALSIGFLFWKKFKHSLLLSLLGFIFSQSLMSINFLLMELASQTQAGFHFFRLVLYPVCLFCFVFFGIHLVLHLIQVKITKVVKALPAMFGFSLAVLSLLNSLLLKNNRIGVGIDIAGIGFTSCIMIILSLFYRKKMTVHDQGKSLRLFIFLSMFLLLCLLLAGNLSCFPDFRLIFPLYLCVISIIGIREGIRFFTKPLYYEQRLSDEAIALYKISKREAEICSLLLQGHSAQRIADELFISHRTVETHINHIYKKCSCTTRAELIALWSNLKSYT